MATLMVSTGKAIVTNRIRGLGTEPLYVAWGTGAGTTAIGDVTLFSEVNGAGAASGTRVTGTSTQQTTTVTNDTYQVVGTVSASTALTITNAGLFDTATFTTGAGPTLFIKGDFTGIALNAGDSIQFTIKAQFS